LQLCLDFAVKKGYIKSDPHHGIDFHKLDQVDYENGEIKINGKIDIIVSILKGKGR